MFSHDEYHVSDASSKTRQRTILTPTSDNSLDGLSAGAKKRKRDGSSMEDLLKDSFVVRPHPSTVLDKPRTLQPLILLPRSQLPLSCLDIFPSFNPLPQSRIFEAHVKILELEERMGSQPMVLIAKVDTGKTLYAVERESKGLYVLCQLGPWVDLQQLVTAGTLLNERTLRAASRAILPTSTAADRTTVIAVTAEAAQDSKKKRLAIEAIQSMVKRPSTDALGNSQQSCSELLLDSQQDSQVSIGAEILLDSQQDTQMAMLPVEVDPVPSQPTATEIFDTVRSQYLEALYLSKASLAYFAKGPLSRARAAFHLDYDSTLDMNEYIAFLESLILSTTLIDKKYRDGLPACISLLDIQDHTADELDQAAGKPKKKRTSRKMKPGKTGLYPFEDSFIRKWWESHDEDAESGAPGNSREELTKSRVSQLRIRETQLQMVVILEVLALQPLATQSVVGGDLPDTLPSDIGKESKDKSVKARKPEHLLMLIDVHIDRLCIWQSIALEISKVGDSQGPAGTEQPDHSSKPTSDILRDFCIDVIAPFFSARLPEHCASINRKLGGPVATPGKTRLPKAASSSGSTSRPGAATKRAVPVKPRTSLKRVLSDERERERRSVSRGPARAISLMRSASIPNLKREASEPVCMANIPLADSQADRMSLNTKRLAQREVDFSSLVVNSQKAKRQANIEAELKEAISALKKPNRELAGKTLVETAEHRAATVSRSARKTKKPIRNPLFQGVQISATPKTKRQKDVFGDLQQQTSTFGHLEDTSPDIIPLSSVSRIPQSAVKSSGGIGPTRNPFLDTVQATPTKKSCGGFSRLDAAGNNNSGYGGCLPLSPLHARRSSAQLFPTVLDFATPTTASSAFAVQETPVKSRADVFLQHGHPSNEKENLTRTVETEDLETANDSIYKSLGWDDDIDDLA
ncbi:hypothetical protein BP6252_00895 [Coleophoma cylindrospora]|uniref:DNA replication regulator Sld3 C-terminal domain-containing protein n=1 Tax=Coleophoma cylindrospora TaxID=1849047 RepID=A0A3D8SRC7_9HELO|nr:hypothetical protein BP6252_00895 [Coleophoma cylindrospora]